MRRLLFLVIAAMGMFKGHSQALVQTYTDRCTGEVKVFTVDMNGSTVVAYYNRSRVFTAAEFTNGTLQAWLEETYSWWQALSPCSTGQANTTTTQQTTTNATTNATNAANNATSNATNNTGTTGTGTTNTGTTNTNNGNTGTTNTGTSGGNSSSGNGSSSSSSNSSSGSGNQGSSGGDSGGSSSGSGDSGGGDSGSSSGNDSSGSSSDGNNSSDQGSDSSGSDNSSGDGDSSNDSSSGGSDEGSGGESEEGSSNESSEESSNEESSEESSSESEESESESSEESESEEKEEVEEEESKEEESEEEESKEEESEEEEEEQQEESSEEEEEEEEKEKKLAPPIVTANLVTMSMIDGMITQAASFGYSQSSLTGEDTYNVNAMVWSNLKQYSVNLSKSHVFFNYDKETPVFIIDPDTKKAHQFGSYMSKGSIMYVQNISAGYMRMFSTHIATVGISNVYMGQKDNFWKGFVGGFAITGMGVFLEGGNVVTTAAFTDFGTKPFPIKDRLTISPMLAYSMSPLTYDFQSRKGIFNEHGTYIIGSNFDFKLSQRFNANIGGQLIGNTLPGVPLSWAATIGSRFQF